MYLQKPILPLTSLPRLSPGCGPNISSPYMPMLCFCIPSRLLPPSPCFLFVFVFCQEVLVHQCGPPGIFCWFPVHWDGHFFSSEDVILEYPLSLDPLPSNFLSQGILPIIYQQPPISGFLKLSSMMLICALISQDLDTNCQSISIILSNPSRIVLCEKNYVIFVNWDTWWYLILNVVLYEPSVNFLLSLLYN